MKAQLGSGSTPQAIEGDTKSDEPTEQQAQRQEGQS
jgi:hypothetical protein